MSEKIVIARHRQVCDVCHGHIEAGKRCRLIRDDFWPLMTLEADHREIRKGNYNFKGIGLKR